MPSDTSPIYVYWVVCDECGHETVAHSRVRCSCGGQMSLDGLAGAVVDDRQGAADAE